MRDKRGDLNHLKNNFFLGSVIAFLMELSEYLLLVFTSSLTLSIAGVFKVNILHFLLTIKMCFSFKMCILRDTILSYRKSWLLRIVFADGCKMSNVSLANVCLSLIFKYCSDTDFMNVLYYIINFFKATRLFDVLDI